METSPEPTDQQLAAAIASRDEQALALLYDRHSAKVFAIALRVVHDRHDAEEVTLDVFTEFWEKQGHYNPLRASVRTYLVNLARSRAIDRLRWNAVRGRNRTESLNSVSGHQEFVANDFVPEASVIAQEEGGHLAHVLAGLSKEQRRVLVLSYFEGLSHREIAERLGLPLGTVKTLIRQGVLQLREAFRLSGFGDSA